MMTVGGGMADRFGALNCLGATPSMTEGDAPPSHGSKRNDIEKGPARRTTMHLELRYCSV